MFIIRRGLLLFAAFLLAWSAAAQSSAATFSTAAHPLSSSLLFDIYLGDPSEDPLLDPLGSVGPNNATGTAEIQLTLDGSLNGTMRYQGSALEIESSAGTFDLGGFGTVDYSLQGVTLTFYTDPIDVVAGDYAAPFADNVGLIFYSGTILIDNATGPLGDIVGSGTLFERHYDVEPILAYWPVTTSTGFMGTVDAGPGGFVDAAEASLIIPGVTFPIIDVPNVGPISLGLSGEIYLAVPEPSSLSLAALGFGGLVGFTWRRQRHNLNVSEISQNNLNHRDDS